jgi:hypothetical protein
MTMNSPNTPRISYDDRQAIKDLADRISNFVNSMPEEVINELGREMTNDHRTLVQNKGRLVRGFLKQLQVNYKNGFVDARNEAICKWADDVLNKVDGPHLPFI